MMVVMIVNIIISVSAVRTGVGVTRVAGIGWWGSTFGIDGTLTGVSGRTVRAVTVITVDVLILN